MIEPSSTLAFLSLLGWVYLGVGNGGFWRPLMQQPSPEPESWPDIDIIVPARNEADSLPLCLPSLLAQDYPGTWRIILVDDHSSDGTGNVAREIAARKNLSDRLMVIDAPELPEGWNGKVASMQAGIDHSKASYVLFTDADIWHPTSSLRRLASRAVEQKLDLTSLMVRLHCETAVEKLLIPAFVFFFAMLYPFRHANDPHSKVAAAAGGVMLVNRAALDDCGGLEKIKSNLIDDCALAKLIKHGRGPCTGRIELSLSKDVRSLRSYEALGEIWRMISRTAFTQLNYSKGLLSVTVIGLLILFIMPLWLPLTGGVFAVQAGMLAFAIMAVLYLPTVLFYRLPFIWCVTLPLAALIYIGATVDSARLYWQGRGGQWKGRSQA